MSDAVQAARCLSDRLAGRAFALATDPSSLAAQHGYSRAATPSSRCHRKSVADFVMNLSRHGYIGANVTIPHKERVLKLTAPDRRARAVGAANTLWYDHGTLRATNTDVEGFIDNLDHCAPRMGSCRRCAGARCRRLVARGGVRLARARHQACLRRQSQSRSRARQWPRNSARVLFRWRGRHVASMLPRVSPAGEHDVARHEGASRHLIDRSRSAACAGRRRRSRLCAARHAAACRGTRAWPAHGRWARHACCIRPCAVSNCGSASDRR